MHRRSLLLGAAAAVAAPLARPAIAGAAQTLSIVPQVALNSIDPVWTSSQIARNMGFMVFDLLYGRDEAMNPRLQMLEGDLAEDNARRWTLRLRENLWFHDGEPVRSRDCIASLRRWMVRDQGGVTLSQRIDAIEAPDDRTIVSAAEPAVPASAHTAVEVHHPRGDDAGAAGVDRSVQADPRSDRQRPVPLARGRARAGQPRRVREIRPLRAARRAGELHRRRASRAGGSRRVEDDPRRRHRGERAGDRRGGLDRNPAARPAADAAEGAGREDRRARQPTARSASCDRTMLRRRPAIRAFAARCWRRSTSRR